MNTAQSTKKGFILLMSILVASIILAISFGVYALSIKEVILASYLKDSAHAFSAADRGVECALFWDRSAPQNGMPYTVFATSGVYTSPWVSDPALYPSANVICDENTQFAGSWTVNTTSLPGDPADTGRTKFSLVFPDNSCADVEVFKESNSTTTIRSDGYNTCDPNNPRRTQRTIQVEGNF